jgi:LysR family transcriptional activator of glutamate synthase operon
MQVTYSNYEYFLAVVDCGSITKAAEKLYISQPSLTKYISRLEANLGTELFDHRRKPLVLSEAGQVYYNYLRSIQKLDASMAKKLQEIKDKQEKQITIAVGSYFASYLFPHVILNFQRDNPNINLRVIAGDDLFCYHMVLAGTAHLGLLFQPMNYKKVQHQLVAQEPIYLFCRADHPALSKIPSDPEILQSQSIDLTQLKHETFFVPQPGLTLNKLSYKVFRHYKIRPNHLVTVPNVQSAVNLASIGEGFCFVPGSIIKTNFYSQNNRFYPVCTPPLSCPLGIIYSKSSVLTNSMQKLIDCIQTFFFPFASSLSSAKP